MASRVVTAVLFVVLIVVTAVLGLTFAGGTPVPGTSQTQTGAFSSVNKGGNEPHFLVRAQMIRESYLYAASAFRQIPAYMLLPVRNLRFVLTEYLGPSLTRHGRPPTYFVDTNVTGYGKVLVPAGNYSVQAAGDVYLFNASVIIRPNSTAFLSMEVVPAFVNVSSIETVNQDTATGVEPTATLYVAVVGSFQYAPLSFYELIGNWSEPETGSPSGLVTINASIAGEYRWAQGTWVVMKPLSQYDELPTTGIKLLQYKAIASVNESAS